MDRVIVIKSNNQGLNEASMELAELFSQGFRIEGKEECWRTGFRQQMTKEF